jgi:hypothetical protein
MKITGGSGMQVQGATAVERQVYQFSDPDHPLKWDEAMWFLVWIGVWAVALAILLPALI